MGKPKKGRRSDRQRYSRRDAQYDLDNDEDIALLSKPFEASIKGVIDLMKAFENGTREVQYLLQYECGLLFECRVCRSIFRSIVNFITHKRVYCRGKGPSDSSQTGQSFDEFMKDVQSLVILQEPAVCEPSTSPTTAPTNNNLTTETTNEKPSPPRLSKRKAFPRKNLIEVLDRLCQKESTEMERPVVLTSRDRACVTSVNEPKLQTPVLCLEKIDHTDVAMRQTVTLGPDGKILNDKHDIKLKGDVIDVDTPLDPTCDSSQSEITNIERLCKPCNVKFSTRKTFRQHIKSKHNSNPSWYLCPDCKSIFSQIYSVHRHLRRFHRKSESQMQKLHGKIKHLPENQLPAAYAASISNKKPVSKNTLRETKRLVVSQKDVALENEVFDLCLTEKNTCSGCTRKFDRVASFNTHMQTCPRRLAVLNNTKSQSETPSAMCRTLMRNSGDSFLTRNYLSETVDTKALTNVTNPQYFVSHAEIADDNSNSDLISTSSDFQNQSMVLNHRSRHDSEQPVKRIEIQLRMDYNKVSIGSSQAQVTASSSDLLDTSTIANIRKSPDTVGIDGRLKLEQNEPISSHRTHILSGKEEENVNGSTNTIKNNKLLKKSINEESTQEPAINTLEKQLAASVVSNSPIIQDVLIEKYVQTTVETMFEETNEDEIMPQVDEKPTSGEVVDMPAKNCQKYSVIENHLEDIESKTLVDSVHALGADSDIQVAAVICNRPKVITQLVHNRKITKNKILRYRCGECWHQFSSLRGGQNHIEKCHTTGKLWRNNARSGVLSSSWTCVSNNSKRSTSVDTCELDSEMNGDVINYCETDQLLSLGDPLKSDKFEEPNHPTKCSINISSGTSTLGISTSKQVPKITKAFPPKERKELGLVVNEKETLNTNEDSSSIIGLRPKRHRMNSQINATANKVEKVVQITRKPATSDQRPTNVKTARKAHKEGKQWSEKDKIDVHLDGKRAKLEFLSTQPPDVSSENDQVPATKPRTKQVHIPTSTSMTNEQVEPETKVADESQAVSEPIKSQVQDNTNIYKNVSKSVIEVIFGSDLSSNMFSSDNLTTEEEVTIIEDQISGTFSVDISSTPEKSRDNLNTIQNESEGSSATRRRISFSLDSEQISSPDSGQGSSDMVLEACHSADDLLNSIDPNCNSSNTIEENSLSSKTVLEGLEKVQAQNACPIILLEKLTDHNSVINTEMMLVETDGSSCCISNSSAKQRSVSSLKTIAPTEESKLDVNKMSTPGYNISTRKSMRVFDTKPLRRTTSIDADAHCKR